VSYQDPEALYAKIAAGDPGRVTAATEPIDSAVRALEDAKGRIRSSGQTALDGWEGQAATAFKGRLDRMEQGITGATKSLNDGANIVRSAASHYGTVKSNADRIISEWRSRPRPVESTPETKEQERQLAEQVCNALRQLQNDYESLLRELAQALGAIPPGFEEAAKDSPSWAAVTTAQSAKIPPPGTDPREVAKWWKSLSPEEQAQLLATHYQELGRLHGLPAEVLDKANRARLIDDERRLSAEHSQLQNQIAQRAKELGLDPKDEEALRNSNDQRLKELLDRRSAVSQQLSNIESINARISEAESQATTLNPNTDRGVYLLHYDPAGSRNQGELALAFGNPDEAKNIAVTVPGTTASVNEEGGNFFNQALNLRAEMDTKGGPNATIQWLGYDAPDAIYKPEVSDPKFADEGAPKLAQDVAGYRAAAEANGNKPHITVIGHSYGSVVVGKAGLHHGLAADDTVFIGSPGVGASSADQLSSGRGHVWAGLAEHDPIMATSGSWFTEDGSSTGPYDRSFGANVFNADSGKHIGNAHTDYYKSDTTSLDNLADIATGNYKAAMENPPSWVDRGNAPDLPFSDKPYIGPVIDWAANTGKEIVDMGNEVWTGGKRVVENIGQGNWSGAGEAALETLGEVGSDALDVVVGTVGEVGELGQDVVSGGKKLWDNTVGRLF